MSDAVPPETRLSLSPDLAAVFDLCLPLAEEGGGPHLAIAEAWTMGQRASASQYTALKARLEALIAEWRERSRKAWADKATGAYMECADELERALEGKFDA